MPNPADIILAQPYLVEMQAVAQEIFDGAGKYQPVKRRRCKLWRLATWSGLPQNRYDGVFGDLMCSAEREEEVAVYVTDDMVTLIADCEGALLRVALRREAARGE